MRFMMLMIPGVYQGARAADLKEGFAPDPEMIEKMSKFNEELSKAGALLSLDGLQPPSKAARVSFADATSTVTNGPFTDTSGVVGGYWIIQAASREDAVNWAKKCPAQSGDVIEVRQIFEMSDFPV